MRRAKGRSRLRSSWKRFVSGPTILQYFKETVQVNGFLMLIVQFVVSVVCAFMAGYMGPYLLYGRTDMGSR